MIIYRKAKWYRPYYFESSGKEYKVNKIHFYQDGKILVTSNSAWLENKNGGDVENLELPIEEIKIRRKVNFDNTVFAISKGKEFCGTEIVADLYIPADMLNIHFVEYQKKYDTQIRAIYKGEQNIYIDVYIKSIDGKLNEIRTEFDNVYKQMNSYKMLYGDAKEILEDIDKLKELAEKLIEEKTRLHNLSINDIEIETE